MDEEKMLLMIRDHFGFMPAYAVIAALSVARMNWTDKDTERYGTDVHQILFPRLDSDNGYLERVLSN